MSNERVGPDKAIDIVEKWDKPNQEFYNIERPLPTKEQRVHRDPDRFWNKVLDDLLEEDRLLRVVDVGGGFGTHYYGLKHHLGKRIPPLKWDIIECAPLVQEGRRACIEPEINYYSDVTELNTRDSIDILHMSAVIFTMHMHELKTIFSVCNSAKYIIILNTPLAEDVSTQYLILPPEDDPGFYCVHNISNLIHAVGKEGYKLVSALGRADLMNLLPHQLRTSIDTKLGLRAYNILIRKTSV